MSTVRLTRANPRACGAMQCAPNRIIGVHVQYTHVSQEAPLSSVALTFRDRPSSYTHTHTDARLRCYYYYHRNPVLNARPVRHTRPSSSHSHGWTVYNNKRRWWRRIIVIVPCPTIGPIARVLCCYRRYPFVVCIITNTRSRFVTLIGFPNDKHGLTQSYSVIFCFIPLSYIYSGLPLARTNFNPSNMRI